MIKISGYLITITSAFLLVSCAPYHFSEPKAPICNELNSRLIFNPSTSNIRQANIQHAEEPLLQHSYETHGCDQR